MMRGWKWGAGLARGLVRAEGWEMGGPAWGAATFFRPWGGGVEDGRNGS